MKPWTVSALKRGIAGATATLAMALSLHTSPVLAHAMLVKAEPARRAALAKAPVQVRLWFNEEVEKDYAALTLLDESKRALTEVIPQISADDPKSIVLPLPELPPGKYTVKFRVLSVDGHVVDSSYDFTVKSKAPGK